MRFSIKTNYKAIPNALPLIFFALLLFYSSTVLAQMKYPLTLGGFNSNTQIREIAYDDGGNLAFWGYTVDSAFSSISTSYPYFVGYLQANAASYSWIKQINVLGYGYAGFDISQDQSMVVFMLQAYNYIFVFQTSTGNLIYQQYESGNLLCYAGCEVFFYNNVMHIYGHLGGWNLMLMTVPLTSVNTRSTSYWYSANGGYYLGAATRAIGSFELWFSPYTYSGHTYCYLQGMTTSYPFQVNLFLTIYNYCTIPSIQVSSSGGQQSVFGYIQDESCTNCFHVFRMVTTSSTAISSFLQFRFVAGSGAFSFQHLKAQSITKVYAVNYLTAGPYTYLYDIDFSSGTTVTYTRTIITSLKSMTLSNAWIQGSTVYLAGYSAYNLFATNTNTGTYWYQIGFIYSSSASDSVFTVTPTVESAISTSYFRTSYFWANTNWITWSTTSVTFYTTGFTTYNPLTPAHYYIDNCLIPLTPNSTTTLNYYIYDTLTYTPTLVTSASPTGATYWVKLEVTDATVTLSYTQATNLVTISSTNTAKDGLTAVVIQQTIMPTTYYTNCVYAYKILTINYYYPLIVVSTVTGGTYNIRSVTPLTITIPVFTNDKGITDTKLDIVYTLQTSGGAAYTTLPFITFDSSTRVISVSTMDPTKVGTYAMRVMGTYQSYRSGYAVYSANFNIVLADPCLTTVITASSLTTQYYQIGQTASTFSFTAFTDTVGNCGTMSYAAYQNSMLALNSFLTFTSSTRTFSVYSASSGDHGSFTIQVVGTLADTTYGVTYGTAQFTFTMRLISTTISYITSSGLTDQYYTIRDPSQSYTYPVLTSSDATLTLVYGLTNFDGTSVDSSIFTYTSATRTLTFYTIDNTKMGSYNMKVKANFNVPIPYYVEDYFQVHFVHMCTRNNIQSSYMSDVSYNVSSSAMAWKVDTFDYNITECGPLVYTATMMGGASLPNFLTFSEHDLSFRLFTLSPEDVGTYAVTVKALATIYDTSSSSLQSTFLVSINCYATKLTPREITIEKNFRLGTYIPSTVEFRDFIVSPVCNYPQNVEYTVGLENGGDLPSFIRFESQQKMFVMYDDGKTKPQTIKIVIKGKVDPGITNKIILTLNVLAEQAIVETSSGGLSSITMPSVYIQLAPGQEVSFESTDIQAVTKNPYSLINTDSLIKYLKLTNEILTVSPSELDQGEIKVYLMAIDDDNRKITQEINIVVNYGTISTGKNRTIVAKEFTARITEITKTGVVQIRFTDKMQNLTNISLINNQTLKLTIRTKDKTLKQPQPTFTWETIEYQGTSLKLQLKFDDPVAMSQDVRISKGIIVNLGL